MKSIKIKDSTHLSWDDPDTHFTMVFMQENKSKKLDPSQIRKDIAFISNNKFFDCFNYAEKDSI